MMRKTIFSLLSTVLLISLCSCDRWTHDGFGEWRRSYVEGYTIPQRIKVLQSEDISAVDVLTSGVQFIISGEALVEGVEYDALCKKAGDMSYKRPYSGPPIIALAQDIQKVSLIALDNFDAEHLTGMNLSEVVDITFTSVALYIKNGYNKTPVLPENRLEESNPLSYVTGNYGLIPYKMRMNEVNAENSHLCGNEFYMKFTKEPQEKGLHRFKLIIQFEDFAIEQECVFYFG